MATRTPTIAVQCARRSFYAQSGSIIHQTFVNISIDNSQYRSLGPFEQELSLTEGISLALVELRLEGEIDLGYT